MALRDFYNPSVITDPFGTPRENGTHTGTDFAFPEGTPIPALFPGTVTNNAYDSRYGNYLDVKVNDSKTIRYGHMAARSGLGVGSKVFIGQIIGNVGSTGYADGPHLHLEIRNTDGTFSDPMPIVQQIINLSDSDIQALNNPLGESNAIGSILNVSSTVIDAAGNVVSSALGAVGVVADVAGYAADLLKWILTERHWWAILFGAGGLAMMGVGASIYFNKEISSTGMLVASKGMSKNVRTND